MKFLIVITMFCSLSAYAAKVGEMAPEFKGTTANDKELSLKELRGKVVVLEWLNHGCPFVKKHYGSGNMQKLQQKYVAEDVVWVSIISSAPGKQGYSDPDKAKEDKKKHGSKATYIVLDKDGRIGQKYEAKTTPHMFIVNKKGELVYEGAIDSISSADPGDISEAKNYVALALDALKQKQEVTPAKTRPYGCSVKY
jgi:thioredoxin-related protein